MRDGINERIEVEGGQVWILCLDEHYVGSVVPGQKVTVYIKRLLTCRSNKLKSKKYPKSVIFLMTLKENLKRREKQPSFKILN